MAPAKMLLALTQDAKQNRSVHLSIHVTDLQQILVFWVYDWYNGTNTNINSLRFAYISGCVHFQRNTVKRMCVKTLPPVLCIQLKRFDYDWEANRAIKFDDYFKVLYLPITFAYYAFYLSFYIHVHQEILEH